MIKKTAVFFESFGFNKNLYIFGQPIWFTSLVDQKKDR